MMQYATLLVVLPINKKSPNDTRPLSNRPSDNIRDGSSRLDNFFLRELQTNGRCCLLVNSGINLHSMKKRGRPAPVIFDYMLKQPGRIRYMKDNHTCNEEEQPLSLIVRCPHHSIFS